MLLRSWSVLANRGFGAHCRPTTVHSAGRATHCTSSSTACSRTGRPAAADRRRIHARPVSRCAPVSGAQKKDPAGRMTRGTSWFDWMNVCSEALDDQEDQRRNHHRKLNDSLFAHSISPPLSLMQRRLRPAPRGCHTSYEGGNHQYHANFIPMYGRRQGATVNSCRDTRGVAGRDATWRRDGFSGRGAGPRGRSMHSGRTRPSGSCCAPGKIRPRPRSGRRGASRAPRRCRR